MEIQIPKEKMTVQNFTTEGWVDGGGNTINIESPYSGGVVGTTTGTTKENVDKAIAQAVEAQKKWAKVPLKERTQILLRFRDNLLKDADKISQVVALESGKTHAEAKAGLMKGVEVLEFAASLQNLDNGGRMEVSRGVFCEYRREPLGVVASITPFNFPAMVPMWTIPIAVTVGNAYVWKPSEKTPLTSYYVLEAYRSAGLPDGVLTVLQGEVETVTSILENENVKAVGFVGSSKVAKIVYDKASLSGKRALCLGGAKNHIVLLPDADKELTGRGISDSFTGCAGQRCMAASVLLAVGNVDAHIEKIVERAKSAVLGESMGAIITKEQVEFLSKAIDEAVKEGATLVLDGRQAKAPNSQAYKDGFWIGPTILDNVKPGSTAACDELFGPILSIVRCNNITQAMEIENLNPYGNACSVFTSTGSLAEKVIQQATAGMVGVNIGVPVPREPFSFGGINISKYGSGDITGETSLNFWSDLKKVTTKWEAQSDENWMS